MFFFKNKNNSSFTLTLRQKLRVNRVSSFTLIELLIVIGILAVLMVAVVVVLNPAEYLRDSRDSKRLTDLSSLHNALQTLEALSASAPSLGTPLTVYISIADEASSTCGSLGLPALPTGYVYHCVTSANLKNTDGTGWIPVNFQDASGVIQISALPIDPVNSTTTSNYYTYIPGGSYELSTIFESTKYRLSGDKDKVSIDGGDNYSMYEVGSNLSLNPLKDTGLVGWWKFDETTGTIAYDSSGNGNNLTMYQSLVPTFIITTNDCKVNNCGSFVSALSRYATASKSVVGVLSGFSYGGWFKGTGYGNFMNEWDGGADFALVINGNTINSYMSVFVSGSGWINSMTSNTNDSQWHHIFISYNGAAEKIYIDGAERFSNIRVGSVSDSVNPRFNFKIGANTNGTNPGGYIEGLIDDVRIYNRALSASEIMNLYNATR